jgi:hypothetical protein
MLANILNNLLTGSNTSDKESINMDSKNRVILATDNAFEILTNLHSKLIHHRRTKFYETIKHVICAKNIKRIVREITDACLICNTTKEFSMKYGKVSGGLLAKENFETISIDILGPI